MKYLFALFAFAVLVIGILVNVLNEERKMDYSDRLTTIQNHDCVVLIHGLLMNPFHMSFLKRSLEHEGYRVTNIGYPSRKADIPTLVRTYIIPQLPQCEGRIHFVGHSMGGIIIRELLRIDMPPNIGNIVMLGAPNHGSELVDFSINTPILSGLFDTFYGPAARQLRIKDNDYLKELPMPVVPTGIIAGDNFYDPIGGYLVLPSPNDGKVSVATTKLDTMTDHIVIHASHTWLPISHEARKQVIYFLKNGKFER